MALGKLETRCKRMWLDWYLTPYKKINSKWIKDLNVRSETIKLLEENIGSNFFDIGLSGIFLGMSAQARQTKVKVNKWDYIKLKGFCTAKKTIHKTRRQPTELQIIYLKRDYYPNYIKNSYNSTTKNNPIKKWAEDLNKHFLPRRHKDEQQACEKMFNITNREMQIKTRMRYHLMLVRIVTSCLSENSQRWKGCGEKGNFILCWLECKLVQPLWKTVWRLLKN